MMQHSGDPSKALEFEATQSQSCSLRWAGQERFCHISSGIAVPQRETSISPGFPARQRAGDHWRPHRCSGRGAQPRGGSGERAPAPLWSVLLRVGGPSTILHFTGCSQVSQGEQIQRCRGARESRSDLGYSRRGWEGAVTSQLKPKPGLCLRAFAGRPPRRARRGRHWRKRCLRGGDLLTKRSKALAAGDEPGGLLAAGSSLGVTHGENRPPPAVLLNGLRAARTPDLELFPPALTPQPQAEGPGGCSPAALALTGENLPTSTQRRHS